jgi:heat shock protein HslJ
MAGPEPAMRAEGAFTKLLVDAKSFKLSSGTLTLYDGGGNESLVFEAVGK